MTWRSTQATSSRLMVGCEQRSGPWSGSRPTAIFKAGSVTQDWTADVRHIAQHWRERSNEVRRLAANEGDPETRRAMLLIAADYNVVQRLADARKAEAAS